MKRTTIAAAVLAALLTGCASPAPQQQFADDDEFTPVCLHPATGQAVDDDYCEDDDGTHIVAFLPWGKKHSSGHGYTSKPGVGTKIQHFQREVPPNAKVQNPGRLRAAVERIKARVARQKPATGAKPGGAVQAPRPKPHSNPAPRTGRRP